LCPALATSAVSRSIKVRKADPLIFVLTLEILVAGARLTGNSPPQAVSQYPPNTPSEIARDLAGRGAVVQVLAEGKVKHSITKEAPKFALPGGSSSVMLLQLPAYRAPYVMTIASSRRGIGRTTEIFVPSGFYLDADFQHVGEFGEDQLAGRAGGQLSAEAVVAELALGESDRKARYLLLYTRGDMVGQPPVQLVIPGQDVLGIVSGAKKLFRVERSFEASIEVATRMRPGYDGVQTKPLSDIARLMIDRGQLVHVPLNGQVKSSVAKGAPTFSMAGGASSIVLLQLPDYSAPYHLKLESLPQRSSIFVPSGVYLDVNFQQVGEFGEERLSGQKRFAADLAFGEQEKQVRYVLLYTRGDLVGLSVQRNRGIAYVVEKTVSCVLELLGTPTGCGYLDAGPVFWLERSLDAKLELETTLDARRKKAE
jgi:hypothetical protein